MDLDLGGRSALVTGGARGIGFAICELLAGEGARVVIADIDPEGAGTAAAKLTAAGGIAFAVAGDAMRCRRGGGFPGQRPQRLGDRADLRCERRIHDAVTAIGGRDGCTDQSHAALRAWRVEAGMYEQTRWEQR